MWILWTMTLKSTVLPVSGSTVCGEWQRTQSLTSWREPPCAESGLWQVLQAEFAISSQTSVTVGAVGHEVLLDVVVVVLVLDAGHVARRVDAERRRDRRVS